MSLNEACLVWTSPVPELHLRDCRLSQVLWLSDILPFWGILLQWVSCGLQELKVLNECLRIGETLLDLSPQGLPMVVVKFHLFM